MWELFDFLERSMTCEGLPFVDADFGTQREKDRKRGSRSFVK